jgi:hypothetical protein
MSQTATNNSGEASAQELYSYHVFLFPFKFDDDCKPPKGDLKKSLCSRWDKKDDFKLDTTLNYNEYNYFYDFVRDTLYDLDKSDLRNKDSNNTFTEHYAFNLNSSSSVYKIYVKDTLYKLEIDSILLHYHDNGVGVLSFHLNNRDINQKSSDDILKINQFGRRIYPPFLGLKRDDIGTDKIFIPPLLSEDQKEAAKQRGEDEIYDMKYFENALDNSVGIELSKGIEIVIPDFCTNLNEEFIHYTNFNNFKKDIFHVPSFISGILWNEKLDKEDIPKIQPVLDDRMFTICWYGDDQLSFQLRKKKSIKSKILAQSWKTKAKTVKFNDEGFGYNYENSDWWYAFVFVDGSSFPTCQHEQMKFDLLKEATNGRWANFGTLIGVSRYSFVVLSESLKSLKSEDYKPAFLVTHTQTMYYKMVELVLLQRSCLQKFSENITDLTSKLGTNETELAQKVRELYAEYIRFVNKIYFREITAQDQGIEIYNLLQKQMNIEANVKALDGEIEELHRYVTLLERKRLTDAQIASNTIEKEQQDQEKKRNSMITRFGTLFLLPSLILSFFGMTAFGEGILSSFWWIIAVFFGIIFIICQLYKILKESGDDLFGVIFQEPTTSSIEPVIKKNIYKRLYKIGFMILIIGLIIPAVSKCFFSPKEDMEKKGNIQKYEAVGALSPDTLKIKDTTIILKGRLMKFNIEEKKQ